MHITVQAEISERLMGSNLVAGMAQEHLKRDMYKQLADTIFKGLMEGKLICHSECYVDQLTGIRRFKATLDVTSMSVESDRYREVTETYDDWKGLTGFSIEETMSRRTYRR